MSDTRRSAPLLGCTAALVFAAEWVASVSAGLSPTVHLLLLGGVALVAAALALLAMRLLSAPSHDPAAEARAQLQAERTARTEALRRIRHDVRGALSPALLMSDRLATHAEPGVRRAGEVTVLSVQKAVNLLAEPPPAA